MVWSALLYGQLSWNMMPTSKSSLVVGVSWLRRKEARQWKEAEEKTFHCIQGYVMLCCGLIDEWVWVWQCMVDWRCWWLCSGGIRSWLSALPNHGGHGSAHSSAHLPDWLRSHTSKFLSCLTFLSRLTSVTGTTWRPVQKIVNFQRWCRLSVLMLEEVSTDHQNDSQASAPRCLGFWELIVSVHSWFLLLPASLRKL